MLPLHYIFVKSEHNIRPVDKIHCRYWQLCHTHSMAKTKKELPRVLIFEEDRDFINIECAKKKMSQPEFIRALLEVYKKHFKV